MTENSTVEEHDGLYMDRAANRDVVTVSLQAGAIVVGCLVEATLNTVKRAINRVDVALGDRVGTIDTNAGEAE